MRLQEIWIVAWTFLTLQESIFHVLFISNFENSTFLLMSYSKTKARMREISIYLSSIIFFDCGSYRFFTGGQSLALHQPWHSTTMVGMNRRRGCMHKKKADFRAAKIRKDILFYCPHSPTKQIFSIYFQFRCLSRSKSRGLVLCGSIDKRGERFGKGTKVLSRLRDPKKIISVLEVSEASELALNQLGLRRQCWSPWLPLVGNES